MSAIRVLLPQLQLPELDYIAPVGSSFAPGDLVNVPFRNKQITGVVTAVNINSKFENLREVSAKLDLHINSDVMEFLFKAAKYYMAPVGSMMKLMLPVELSEGRAPKPCETVSLENAKLPILSSDQLTSLEQIKASSNPSVLKGITGSGKTEVYFHHMAEMMAEGKQVLLMLPEIALGSQIIERFKDRFGFAPAIWNSSITKAKKRNLLRSIILGEVKIIIGTRSALFLPYANLGLIVVDEEHDASYKQDDGVMYNARDMAVMRGHIIGTKVLLASATPSIETLYNVSIGKYNQVNLHSRYGEAILPDVEVIDMRLQKRQKDSWISLPLKTAIADALLKKEQVIIFLNRRGYAPMMLCKACGHKVTCKSCSSWLVMHKAKKRLECHHCGYVSAIKNICAECREEDSLIACGPGVERIAEEVMQLFPEAKIQLVTKDEMNSEKAIAGVLARVQNHEIDIIIGTQIITKGYHFPKLSLVGVIDADIGLSGGDLKASERSFQLLYQVSGRAGREYARGKVYLQTFAPEGRLIQLLKSHDFDKFMEYEISTRKDANMPPFSRMAAILISGSREDKVLQEARQIVRMSPRHDAVRILGPAPASVLKLQNKYRYRILLIADRKIDIWGYLEQWMSGYKVPSSLHLKIDIDPYNLN